jgi:hypothetical protein
MKLQHAVKMCTSLDHTAGEMQEEFGSKRLKMQKKKNSNFASSFVRS